jgi:hypothetical protein
MAAIRFQKVALVLSHIGLIRFGMRRQHSFNRVLQSQRRLKLLALQ